MVPTVNLQMFHTSGTVGLGTTPVDGDLVSTTDGDWTTITSALSTLIASKNPPGERNGMNIGLFSTGGGVVGLIMIIVFFAIIIKLARNSCEEEELEQTGQRGEVSVQGDLGGPLPHESLLDHCPESPPSPPPTYSALFSESPLEQNGVLSSTPGVAVPLLDLTEEDETLSDGNPAGGEEVSTPPPTYEIALARSRENLLRSLESLDNISPNESIVSQSPTNERRNSATDSDDAINERDNTRESNQEDRTIRNESESRDHGQENSQSSDENPPQSTAVTLTQRQSATLSGEDIEMAGNNDLNTGDIPLADDVCETILDSSASDSVFDDNYGSLIETGHLATSTPLDRNAQIQSSAAGSVNTRPVYTLEHAGDDELDV